MFFGFRGLSFVDCRPGFLHSKESSVPSHEPRRLGGPGDLASSLELEIEVP